MIPGDDTPLADRLRWLHATYKTPPVQHLSKLPKPTNKDNAKGSCDVCGGWHGLPAVHLDYLGHAELTDILLFVDPCWSWAPYSVDETGQPLVKSNDKGAVMWITLTIWGVTRPGVGTSAPKGPDTYKELIGDGLRNAAMRFGIGVDLWSKAEGVERRIEAGQHVEADSDHDPNAQPAPEPRRTAPKDNRNATQPIPDVWTYDGLIALGLRTLNGMCGDRGLPRTGKLEDYAYRLMEWQAANKTPTNTAADIPGEPASDEDEPATDLPATDPSPPQHPDDGTDPAIGDAPPDPDPDPKPTTDFGDEWDNAPADPKAIALILADIRKLTGSAHTRAYASFRRSKGIPTKADTWTHRQLDEVADFLDRLLAPVQS